MFELTKRQELVVTITSRRVVRVLRHYGRVQYVSRRFHYVILYVAADQVATVTAELEKLRNVSHVSQSPWQTLDPEVVELKSTVLYKTQDEDD